MYVIVGPDSSEVKKAGRLGADVTFAEIKIWQDLKRTQSLEASRLEKARGSVQEVPSISSGPCCSLQFRSPLYFGGLEFGLS